MRGRENLRVTPRILAWATNWVVPFIDGEAKRRNKREDMWTMGSDLEWRPCRGFWRTEIWMSHNNGVPSHHPNPLLPSLPFSFSASLTSTPAVLGSACLSSLEREYCHSFSIPFNCLNSWNSTTKFILYAYALSTHYGSDTVLEALATLFHPIWLTTLSIVLM